MRSRRAGWFTAGLAGASVLLGLGAAGFALRAELARDASGSIPIVLTGLAAAAVLVALVAAVHVSRREDLDSSQKGWLIAGVLVVPFGGVAYLLLGTERTRELLARSA